MANTSTGPRSRSTWFICRMARRRIRIRWGFLDQLKRNGFCAGSFNSFSSRDIKQCLPTSWWTTGESGLARGFLFFPTGPGPNDKGLSRKHIMESCDASLRRLKTDYLDLYQCHRVDPETPLEETIGAMDDLIRRGKVLYWGFSEWPVEEIEKCLQICGAQHLEKPKSSQPQYNMLQRSIESQIMPLSHKAGIGQVVFSP